MWDLQDATKDNGEATAVEACGLLPSTSRRLGLGVAIASARRDRPAARMAQQCATDLPARHAMKNWQPTHRS